MRWLAGLLLLLLVMLAWQWGSVDDVAPPMPAGAPRSNGPTQVEGRAASPELVAEPAAGPGAAVVPGSSAPIAPSPPSADERPAATFLVVDEQGAPVGGARVTAIDGEHDLASGFADAAGELQLRGAPSAFDYRATCVGYWPATGHRADAGTTTRIVLPLAPRLRGRVFDQAGAPLAGVRTVLLAPVPGRGGGPAELPPRTPMAFTDSRGFFDLAWPDAEPRDLLVRQHGYAPFVQPAITAAAQGKVLLTITLQPAASVQGTARRDDGSPLVGATVEVWSTYELLAGGRPGSLPWRELELLGRATTDRAGAFAIDDLPFCATAAVELAPEHGAGTWRGPLPAGSVTRVGLVAAAMARVRGTVVGGTRLDRVYLYGGPRVVRSQRVGADGSFAFGDVPPRSYLVGVATPPLAETLHRISQDWIVGGETPFATAIELQPGEVRTLTLSRPIPTTGSVAGAAFVGGQPAARHEVVLRPVTGEGAFVRRATVNPSGAFLCEGVRPGDYEAELRSAEGTLLVRQSCRVVVDQATVVTLIAP